MCPGAAFVVGFGTTWLVTWLFVNGPMRVLERPLALQGRTADLNDEDSAMTLSSMRVCIAPGEGLVARQGSSVVVVIPSGAEHDPFIDQLLELCAADTEDQRSVVRRIGSLVTGTAA